MERGSTMTKGGSGGSGGREGGEKGFNLKRWGAKERKFDSYGTPKVWGKDLGTRVQFY